MALNSPNTFVTVTEDTPPFPLNDGFRARILDAPGDQIFNVARGGSFELSGQSGSNTVNIEADASDFSVSLDGFDVVLAGPNGESITMPLPSSNQNVVFGDGATTLRVDLTANEGLGGVFLGGQEVTAGDTAVNVGTAITDASKTSGLVFGIDNGAGRRPAFNQTFDADGAGGTQQSPATQDVSGDSFQIVDDASVQSFVDITGFGADDAIELTSTMEDDVNVDPQGENGVELTINNGGTVSRLDLDGFTAGLNVNTVGAFNGLEVGDITFA